MKIKLAIAALAAIGTMTSVQATELNPELKKLAPVKTETKKHQLDEKADFGVYKLQPDLVLVPSSLAGNNNQGLVNGRAIVQQAKVSTDGAVKTDSVVKNLLTGEMGIVTGRISILAKDQASLQQLQQQFGLGLVKAVSKQIAIVQAPAGANLSELIQSIRASGLVREARLDVVETLNQPH
ncbi:hypothetical protein [Rheinheimera sp.]|uniref:hypothetical protein n=1 Tax=Rheinheimera sp. TaxID=1869214 RepID=UPI00260E3881|nr:hypothetical protein [Rheinheimera sp.]MCA1930037.1 hypothetical protein [Rheinheimera sp.]